MKKNDFMRMLVLYCFRQIDGQRTLYSILHLLNGKKSSQTIQDAHYFQLTSLFNTFPRLTRQQMEELTAQLVKTGAVEAIGEQVYRVTPRGNKDAASFIGEGAIPASLNGWKHHQLTDLFWERLSLLVQVLSHLLHYQSHYIPIQRKWEHRRWIKTFLKRSPYKRKELGEELYEALAYCLEKENIPDPLILVLRLTGAHTIGQTAEQAAETLGLDYAHYHLHFLGVIHSILDCIKENEAKTELLRNMIADIATEEPLTLSARKTYSLLHKGLDIMEIAKLRGLKSNTIEDHLVEIALNIPRFDISTYVSPSKQTAIMETVKTIGTKQLKRIREIIPEADYFEIRLVLAVMGDEE